MKLKQKIIGIIYIVSLQKVRALARKKNEREREREKSLGGVTNNVQEVEMNVSR